MILFHVYLFNSAPSLLYRLNFRSNSIWGAYSSQARDSFRTLHAHGLMHRVEISKATVGTLKEYEYIKVSSWIRYMDATQNLKLIFGKRCLSEIRETLRTFWARYEVICPNHMVFERARAGRLKLEQTLPVMLHADEGRTLKKKPLFLVQWQVVFGKGVGKKNSPEIIQARLEQLRLQPNFKGHSFATRFLCGLMLRSDYAKYPDNLDSLLTLICEDLAMLGNDGIEVQGERLWLCCLGNKGDWDYLAKVAHLSRAYRNAPKCPTSKTPDKPMCHLCMAGLAGFPYEDVPLGYCYSVDVSI